MLQLILATVAADASTRIGAVLTQKQQNDQWLPITYTLRAVSSNKVRYTQIEKEELTITKSP